MSGMQYVLLDAQVNAEATVELAYSLSEHGLTPAAFRAFAMALAHHQDTQQVL